MDTIRNSITPGRTTWAIEKIRPDSHLQSDSESPEDIQKSYFGDIKNQISSIDQTEIDKTLNREIENWKKERRSMIANRKKAMKKEKDSNYLKIEPESREKEEN